MSQPEALRLAAWLNEGAWHQMRLGDVEAAGRELRRLHAANLDCMQHFEALKADYDKLRAENEALRQELAKPAPRLTDAWRMAVDAAMVNAGLDCTTPDSDPAQCVELLCKHVASIERDVGGPHLTDADISVIVRDVAELDRDSPPDWPEAMIVTAEELRIIIERRVRGEEA